MTNFKVYSKTLPFSFVMFLVDILALLVVVGASTAGFFIANRSTDMAIVGLFVGLIIGIILSTLISIFVTNRIKAAQIAMMTKGVNEGELPEHTFKEGFNEVRGRFGKITAFFFITYIIKGVFRQLGRGINKLGTAIGGDAGNSVTSAIDTAIQVLIGYLCDCCLGWILFRKEENSFKAGCEGAVIFFKHGKTLIRNVGRIFGMGLLSLLLVGGALFGLLYFISTLMPQSFVTLANEISEISTRQSLDLPAFLTDPVILSLIICGVIAIVVWSMLHSVVVRPFILVGVLRNFMEAGIKDIPSEADFKELDSRSPKFRKLHEQF